MDTARAGRLERGELVTFPVCPFPLPDGDDRRLLLGQRLRGPWSKNICYNPHSGVVTGFARQAVEKSDRLRYLLADFSRRATAWLAQTFPGYAAAWCLDRASLRPEEEATRSLRLTARNDLLHLDAFPNRPANGRRILRLFVNLNPDEPRVWATSQRVAELLPRFAPRIGWPLREESGWARHLRDRTLRLFRPLRPGRTDYDEFMLRLHHALKTDETFQEKAQRRVWHFPPGSAWLLFTDGLTHADLRGRHALEHSYFIARESLCLPAEAPAALLERLAVQSDRRAA